MKDEVEVDTASLLSAAAQVLHLNDASSEQIRSCDQAIAGCSGGFSELAKSGFDGFVDDLGSRRAALFSRLESIQDLTRFAAKRYSTQDLSSSASIESTSTSSSSHLRL